MFMQRENSILLMAFVLIVAIGFIGVNYGRVTGQAVSGEVTKVIVTPPNAYPGDTITIKIDGKCIDGTLGHTLTLRDALGQRIAAIGIPTTVKNAMIIINGVPTKITRPQPMFFQKLSLTLVARFTACFLKSNRKTTPVAK